MPEPEKTSIPSVPATRPVKFHFEKSAGFRSLYIMGAWGRVNGSHDIVFSLFNEIPPLPNSATHEIQADGNWTPALPKLELPENYEMVRQIEADIIMPLDAAKRINANLAHFIRLAEKQIILFNQREAQRKNQPKTA